jgi:hypothetical protein
LQHALIVSRILNCEGGLVSDGDEHLQVLVIEYR